MTRKTSQGAGGARNETGPGQPAPSFRIGAHEIEPRGRSSPGFIWSRRRSAISAT